MTTVRFFGGPADGRTDRATEPPAPHRPHLVDGTEYTFRRPVAGDDDTVIAWPTAWRIRMLTETARSQRDRQAARLRMGDRLTEAGWPRVIADAELELTTVKHETAWTRVVWVLLAPGDPEGAEG